ncbi:hypothetical protein TEA_011937 [Camellia sinensis var. sinensis]|uniref:Uncharacterized protein n=1 Tax=Camellia sinensis var. sinensis TaxID=542762 RepID=A0A4S4ED22_CAMSN|nr:hypothetical protein TEA_011937 [Camellia sinensis var. sinensis]
MIGLPPAKETRDAEEMVKKERPTPVRTSRIGETSAFRLVSTTARHLSAVVGCSLLEATIAIYLIIAVTTVAALFPLSNRVLQKEKEEEERRSKKKLMGKENGRLEKMEMNKIRDELNEKISEFTLLTRTTKRDLHRPKRSWMPSSQMIHLRMSRFSYLGTRLAYPNAASEDELRYYLGLTGVTTGKGNVDLANSNVRPIEVFMCSIVHKMGYGDGFKWLSQYIK